MTFPSTETLLPFSANRPSNSLVFLFRTMTVNRLLGKALSKFRNTRLGRKLTWATTPVTVTCLPILAAALAVPMVREVAFVSAGPLWMAVVVRQRAAVRIESSFIAPAGCVRSGRDSRVKWRQAAARQGQRIIHALHGGNIHWRAFKSNPFCAEPFKLVQAKPRR